MNPIIKKIQKQIFRKSKIRNKTKIESVTHTKLFSSPIQNKKKQKNARYLVKINRVDPEIKHTHTRTPRAHTHTHTHTHTQTHTHTSMQTKI